MSEDSDRWVWEGGVRLEGAFDDMPGFIQSENIFIYLLCAISMIGCVKDTHLYMT